VSSDGEDASGVVSICLFATDGEDPCVNSTDVDALSVSSLDTMSMA